MQEFGLNDKERSRAALSASLLAAHGTQSIPPVSVFGDVGTNRVTPAPGDVALVRPKAVQLQLLDLCDADPGKKTDKAPPRVRSLPDVLHQLSV